MKSLGQFAAGAYRAAGGALDGWEELSAEQRRAWERTALALLSLRPATHNASPVPASIAAEIAAACPGQTEAQPDAGVDVGDYVRAIDSADGVLMRVVLTHEPLRYECVAVSCQWQTDDGRWAQRRFASHELVKVPEREVWAELYTVESA